MRRLLYALYYVMSIRNILDVVYLLLILLVVSASTCHKVRSQNAIRCEIPQCLLTYSLLHSDRVAAGYRFLGGVPGGIEARGN